MAEAVSVDDARSVRAQQEDPLYADRVRVYPKRVQGTFRRVKWTALIVLLAIYYVVPWLRWDRGPGVPDQAVLIDMANERAYLLWLEIWPQELYFLVGLLLLGAVGLFLVTSLAGRVWCGFACPQTVWTDLFMWVERLIEGDRNARIRLDRGPSTAAKIGKKVAKHGVWLAISAATGGAWIMYYNDAPTVTRAIFTGQASLTVYGFAALFTATTYLLGGIAREQVCTFMCPWPRFQAAMFDEDTLVVTYEAWRGEPRGSHRRGDSWEGRGDCVACNQCVAVCPTGIDIRDGSQLECIGCGLCVDACNAVMARVERPGWLITFDTQRIQDARAAGQRATYRVLRPRTVLYSLLFAAIGATVLIGLALRTTLDLNVLHDRNPLFVTLSDGAIRNGYTVKLLDKTRIGRQLALTVEGLSNPVLSGVGNEAEGGDTLFLQSKADNVAGHRVYVRVARDTLSSASTPVRFVVTDLLSGDRATHDTVFRGPER